MVRSTKKPTAKRETDTLRAVQKIAKQPMVSQEQKPPVDGITSSAHALGQDIERLMLQTLHVATTYHVLAIDVLREIKRRLDA